MVSPVARTRTPDGLSNPATAAGKLQRIVLTLLEEKVARDEIPTSIRFLFYELEQLGLISKRAVRLDGKPGVRTPSQNLTDAVTVLREQGAIPWDWIVDEGRQVHEWCYAPTMAEYMLDQLDTARIDPWQSAVRPVILTESRGVGGVLARAVGARYLVTVAPTGGQCHGFLVTKVAPLLKDVGTCVQYVGDRDDAGTDIEANTRRVLERHADRTFDRDTWERVALTDAQVRQLEARGVEPVQKRDRRFKDGNPHLAFEAEALGQAAIVDLVRLRLDRLLPEPLERVRVYARPSSGRRSGPCCAAPRGTGGGNPPGRWPGAAATPGQPQAAARREESIMSAEPEVTSASPEEESLESMLLEAALHARANEVKRKGKPRSRAELKACILAFLDALLDAPAR
jgi:hypothetical protein